MKHTSLKTLCSTHFWEEWLPAELAITILLLHLLTIIYTPYLNHDVAQYISMGQMIVDGALPYTGVVDINPPMIFYISSIPVLIAQLLKRSVTLTSIFYFFSLNLIMGIFFIRTLAIEAIQKISNHEKYLIWTFWIFLSLWTYNTGQFAQREQLIFQFLAAFIVLRKARYERKHIPLVLAIMCGLFAATAILLKAQFILAILGIEAFYLVNTQIEWKNAIGPELFTMAALGSAFIGHFFIIPGASSFFSYWIPFISKGYSVYNADWKTMLQTLFSNPFAAVNLGILVIAILILLQKKHAERQLGLFFAFAIFGFIALIVYFIQFKGWPYQTLGFHFGCLTAVVFLVKEYNQIFVRIKNAFFMLLLILNLTGILITIFNENLLVRQPFQLPESHTTVVTKELAAPNDKVLFISTDVPSVFPQMTYTERLGSSRFLTAFPIKFFTNGLPEGKILLEWEMDDEMYFSWLLQDISKQKPTVIFIDVSPRGDSLSYLRRKGFFQLIPEYKCLGRTDHFLTYYRANEQLRNKIHILYQHQHILQVPGCSENTENLFE